MRISDSDIQKLSLLYEEEFGTPISIEEAKELGESLLAILKALHKDVK